MTFFTIISGPYIRNSVLLKVPAHASSVVEFLGLSDKLELSNAVAKTEQEPKGTTPEAVADISGQSSAITSIPSKQPSLAKDDSFGLLESYKSSAANEGEHIGCILDIAPVPVQQTTSKELNESSHSRVYYNLAVEEEREKMMLTCRAIQSQVMLMVKESESAQSQDKTPTTNKEELKQHLDVKPLLGFESIKFFKMKCTKKTQVVAITTTSGGKPTRRVLKKRSKEDAAIEVKNIKTLKFTGMVPELYYEDDRGFTITSHCGHQCSPSAANLLKILAFVVKAHDEDIVLFDLKFTNFCTAAGKVFLVDLEYAHKTTEILVKTCPGTDGYRCFKLVEAAKQEERFYPHKGYDIFSLGVMLCEVVSFVADDLSPMADPTTLGEYFVELKAGREAKRPPLNKVDSSDEEADSAKLVALGQLIEMVERCFHKQLDQRPTAKKLMTVLADNMLFK